MEKIWINGYGMGPGMPEKYIFMDNGGEFLNEKMLNLCQEAGIKLKSTGLYSPQQNGVNERNHGVTDIMVEKYRREDPNLTLQDAINKAAFAKKLSHPLPDRLQPVPAGVRPKPSVTDDI